MTVPYHGVTYTVVDLHRPRLPNPREIKDVRQPDVVRFHLHMFGVGSWA